MPLARRILPPADEPVASLEAYRAARGLEGLQSARAMAAEKVIDTIRRSGLRGRGGAGFPTAAKWAGAREDPGSVRYFCCNGAEGEPGTFKDRYILRLNPYQVLEGVLIAAHTIGAQRAYICTKARFQQELSRLRSALAQMRAAGVPGAETVEIVAGPDEYLFGEEKALLEVVEGGLPLPHRFPPYIHGLFDSVYGGPSASRHNPTVVGNVETLANIPHIVREGPDWFRTQGTPASPGTMVFTLSGDVRLPGVYELSLGTSLRALIEEIGSGVAPGRSVQAVFSGIANAPLSGDELDTSLDFDTMRAAGSSLGSAGFIVYDDTACMVQVAYNFCNFLHVESCNQCPSCKIGSRQIRNHLQNLLRDQGGDADVRGLLDATTWVENGNRCFLPTSTSLVMSGIVEKFPATFADHVHRRCARRHDLPLPKFVDYDGHCQFTYDTHYVHKQPDWTYDDEPHWLPIDAGELLHAQ